MPAYQFQALNRKGKKEKGVLEGESARQVRQKLRELSLTPLTVEAVAAELLTKKQKRFSITQWRLTFSQRMQSRDLALVTRQLATLISASIPIDDALTAVANQTEKQQVKSILLGVRSKVLEGHAFAAALDHFSSAFPAVYRTTIACGEKSGKLDHVLLKLAEYIENQHAIRRKINQALIYPTLMTLVSIGVVIFMLIYVVPKIVDVFSQTQQTLPIATVILIAVSQLVKAYGLYAALILLLAVYIASRLLKKKSIKMKFDQLLLKLPLIGKNIKTINSARFARTFGILNSATVPVLEAMHAASRLIYPLPMQTAVSAAIEQVREGAAIHQALHRTSYFSPLFIHLLASGEKSGQLELMLQKAAMQQESDVEALIQNVLTLFEPIMILVMGGVVLFIVLSIMLPIFALNQIGG